MAYDELGGPDRVQRMYAPGEYYVHPSGNLYFVTARGFVWQRKLEGHKFITAGRVYRLHADGTWAWSDTVTP